MTLFGRDSLLSAWMALVVDPELALGTLQTLARFQGAELNARTEEQPGRILHEMRFGEASSLSLGAGTISYGTADATPLFVMLLGNCGAGVWPAKRSTSCCPRRSGDRVDRELRRHRRDGYVEYQRMSDRGPAHQGGKAPGTPSATRMAAGRSSHRAGRGAGLCVRAYLARAFSPRSRATEPCRPGCG